LRSSCRFLVWVILSLMLIRSAWSVTYVVDVDAVHFDCSGRCGSSPKDVTLVYTSGDLADMTNHPLVNSVSGLSNTGKGGNCPDFDGSLDGLGDRVLAHGEEVHFTLLTWSRRRESGCRHYPDPLIGQSMADSYI